MHTIIPEPVTFEKTEEFFIVNSKTSIVCSEELTNISKHLQMIFSPATGFKLDRSKEPNSNFISFEIITDEEIGDEGYFLEVSPTQVKIKGTSQAGIFYGVQTLRQLLPIEIESTSKIDNIAWMIPCVKIIDFPRFTWRGFMLDEARHFMGMDIVKQMLDVMALHKLNKFHWHLVDDQGWRIEIKKYPKLIEIGSKRKIVTRRGEKPNLDDVNLIGGFYTQKQIVEIIEYAAERFIEVIPEIELPGHSSAALAAYPELSCRGGPFEVPTRWGIFADVFCPGKENVYEFLRDVIDEVIAIFPTDTIHVGGDEVPKKRWKSCPDCKAKMKKEQMEKVGKLQVFMTNYFAKYLEEKGKRLMGWNQILDDDLAESAIFQYWAIRKKQAIKHIQQGRKVVMSTYLSTYLDHPYQIISLQKAYKYEPIFPELEEEHHSNILGIEPPLWTERIPDKKRLYWQAFPRLTAYAETSWTPRDKKNYRSFLTKLEKFIPRLQKLNIEPAVKKISK